MSLLLIVMSKCMLVTSHAAPWGVTVSMPTGESDGPTDTNRYITHSTGRGQHNNDDGHILEPDLDTNENCCQDK